MCVLFQWDFLTDTQHGGLEPHSRRAGPNLQGAPLHTTRPKLVRHRPIERVPVPVPCRDARDHRKQASEVEPLGMSPLLLVEHVLLGLAELGLRHLHAALAQRQQAGLGADGLDVRAGELVLGHDEFLKVDVVRQGHLGRVDAEDVPLGLDVRHGKLNLAIDAPRADERGVQRLDLVGGQDDLDVPPGIEAIELVEQLEHRALDLALAPRRCVVPFRTHGVDLVNEDDGRRVLVGHPEQLAHELGPVSEVLLDELRAGHTEEGGRCLVGHRLGEERLARARGAVEEHTLGRLDAHALEELRVDQGQLDHLADLTDLLREAADG
mmetsp:Transcript_4964/g.16607  ORF Transcript_4964/g.16607 Transcript_4964/m.16607 type:complete len:323 (-) Transcript_4964:459-1427(-)